MVISDILKKKMDAIIMREARVYNTETSFVTAKRRKWTSECHPRLTIRLGIQLHPTRRCA